MFLRNRRPARPRPAAAARPRSAARSAAEALEGRVLLSGGATVTASPASVNEGSTSAIGFAFTRPSP